jgi:hypothetical protein
MSMPDETAKRPRKITFGELRSSGVRGVVVFCSDFKCSHSTRISADQWPDDVGSPVCVHSMRQARCRRPAGLRTVLCRVGLFLKEKALTIAKAFKFGEGTVLGEQLDRLPLLNRKRAFVVRHHIGRID